MFKKLLVFSLFLVPGLAMAGAPAVRQQAITSVGTGTTVSISTSSWTKVPASTSLSDRTGIWVNNPSSNNAVMFGIISSNSSAPTEATTVRPLEFAPSAGSDLIPVSSGMYLYLLSGHTSAENAHVQEIAE